MVKELIKDQKIEGVWALVFKMHITMVSLMIPPIFAWSAWVTTEQFKDQAFRTSGERFTQTDGRKLEDKVIDKLASKVEQVDQRVQSLERNSEAIKTSLEQIKDALKKE